MILEERRKDDVCFEGDSYIINKNTRKHEVRYLDAISDFNDESLYFFYSLTLPLKYIYLCAFC